MSGIDERLDERLDDRLQQGKVMSTTGYVEDNHPAHTPILSRR